ncbi:hypothetical protein CHUV2995_01002 [Corynebacterium diphtheriae subsp. lausannense]|nr:hypothetical protein FRC0043_02391 [Corynebacterium belfantii]SPJ40214.1 hypothetical protein CHUV2995_01002 [Corynebacterium diphtheriae subsp. lausannense]
MGLIVTVYNLNGGSVPEGFVEACGIPPVNPVHGGKLDLG